MHYDFQLFYQASQRLKSDLTTDDQRRHLKEMDTVFAYYKSKAEESGKFLESEEQQKTSLEKKIKKLQAIENDLANKNITEAKKYEVLKEKCEVLETKNKKTYSSFLSKATKLGHSEGKKENLLLFLSELYQYTDKNKCKTKESFELKIKQKIRENIPFCDWCKLPAYYCECE